MKTQSQSAGPPGAPKPEALEEKITHLTEDFAKTANRFKVPALVMLVLIVAIIAISSLLSFLGEQQEGQWSEKIFLLFEKEPTQIRADAPKLIDELEGKRVEPALVARYARWLFEQDEPGDRAAAISLIGEAKGRHPDSLLLGLAQDEFTLVQEMSEGFELPPIPEPEPPTPAPGTITPIPVPPPGAGTGETGTGETGTGETGTGEASTGEASTGEAGAGTAPGESTPSDGDAAPGSSPQPVLSDEAGATPPEPPVLGDDFGETSPDGTPDETSDPTPPTGDGGGR